MEKMTELHSELKYRCRFCNGWGSFEKGNHSAECLQSHVAGMADQIRCGDKANEALRSQLAEKDAKLERLVEAGNKVSIPSQHVGRFFFVILRLSRRVFVHSLAPISILIGAASFAFALPPNINPAVAGSSKGSFVKTRETIWASDKIRWITDAAESSGPAAPLLVWINTPLTASCGVVIEAAETSHPEANNACRSIPVNRVISGVFPQTNKSILRGPNLLSCSANCVCSWPVRTRGANLASNRVRSNLSSSIWASIACSTLRRGYHVTKTDKASPQTPIATNIAETSETTSQRLTQVTSSTVPPFYFDYEKYRREEDLHDILVLFTGVMALIWVILRHLR